MSGSIVLKEKSLLHSNTSQAPATGLTEASIESAASGSVHVNASVNICSRTMLLSTAQRAQEFYPRSWCSASEYAL